MKCAFSKGGYVDAGDGSGHRIYFESYGPQDAPAFVMVHGNAGYVFDPQKLSMWDLKKQRVIIIHARGIGNSLPAGETAHNLYPDLAEDIETVRAHLNIGKVGLFGWSAGAAICLLYAQKYTQYCRSVTLYGAFLGTQAELENYYSRSEQEHPTGWKKFCAQYGVDRAYDAVRRYNQELINGNMLVQHRAVRRYEQIFGASPAITHDQARLVRNRIIYANMIEQDFGLRNNQIESGMNRLNNIPVSFIRGRNDYIGTPRNGETLINHAGHDVHDPRVQGFLKPLLQQDMGVGVSGAAGADKRASSGTRACRGRHLPPLLP